MAGEEEQKTATTTENNSSPPAEAAKEAPKEEAVAAVKAPETEAAADGKAAATAATPTAEQQPPPAPPKPSVHKPNFEKDTVYLYQFCRTPLLPSISPYCLKVETWLRLASVKYENVDHKMKLRSKKGQLPFIELNGEEVADSSIIVKELAQRFTKDLDAGLDNYQKSISHALISMIENSLVMVVLWWRSKNTDSVLKGYKLNLQHGYGTKIPQVILNFIFKFAFSRKGAKKVKAQGIGVHKPEEIIDMGKRDLKVLSDVLADKPFFFGDEPTLLDIVAFANLAQIYFFDKEVEFALRDFMQDNCANLVGLVNRMKERCYPDWEDMCKTLDLNSHLPKPEPEEKPTDGKGKEEEKKDEKEGDKETEKEIEKEKEKGENEKDVEKDVEENKQKEEKETK
ncbi:failed axon connections [Hetaerina americana]|uniref:failed axon connections n=1 Tax=Hetaerina americana TaxID=62018 RepID=UPI003A7F2E8E